MSNSFVYNIDVVKKVLLLYAKNYTKERVLNFFNVDNDIDLSSEYDISLYIALKMYKFNTDVLTVCEQLKELPLTLILRALAKDGIQVLDEDIDQYNAYLQYDDKQMSSMYETINTGLTVAQIKADIKEMDEQLKVIMHILQLDNKTPDEIYSLVEKELKKYNKDNLCGVFEVMIKKNCKPIDILHEIAKYVEKNSIELPKKVDESLEKLLMLWLEKEKDGKLDMDTLSEELVKIICDYMSTAETELRQLWEFYNQVLWEC